MTTVIQIDHSLLKRMQSDLSRPHAFAAERVGFIVCNAEHTRGGWQLTAKSYEPVPDEQYVDDPSVGAAVSGRVFRIHMQRAHGEPVSILHVHRHDHYGKPAFSSTDLHESRRFAPDFLNVRPELPHGVLVLSFDSAHALIWDPREQKQPSIASVHSHPANRHVKSPQPPELPGREIGSETSQRQGSRHWIVRWWIACVSTIGAHRRRQPHSD